MIIDDLDVQCALASPAKADPVLIVDPDAVLARAISLELLKPAAGQACQIIQGRHGVQPCQLYACSRMEHKWQRTQGDFGSPSVVNVLRCAVTKTDDRHRYYTASRDSAARNQSLMLPKYFSVGASGFTSGPK